MAQAVDAPVAPVTYPDPTRFAAEIEAFATEDAAMPPPLGGVVCVGSSSMRKWKAEIAADLAPLTVVARGFGGSTVHDLRHYVESLVLKYEPRAVMIYEGENDIGMGVSNERVVAEYQLLVATIRERLPDCRIYLLSIKPSPRRAALWPVMTAANASLAAYCERTPGLTYIDIAAGMLLADGTPRPDIFLNDNLHMNRAGYDIWREAIRPILVEQERPFEAGATAPPTAAAAVRITREPSTWVWNFPDAVPLVEHGELHSAAMNRTVGFNVYLPPEYAQHPERRYSVVYFLHGARGDEKSAAALAKVTNAELAAGRTGPVIWVYANGGQFSGYYDWPDQNIKAETLILDELIPEIESRYRTRRDRAGRAICGYSMGGNGAVRFATKFPDRFCAVSAIAGAFGMGRELAVNDNVMKWTREHADQLREHTPMRFYVGAQDPLQEAQLTYLALLDELEMGYDYRVVAGVGHMIGDMWTQVCPDFVRNIANACAPPES